jgi:hypothetical protein
MFGKEKGGSGEEKWRLGDRNMGSSLVGNLV